MPEHDVDCEERAQRVKDLERRLAWERIQRARLLDEIDILRSQLVELRDRLSEYE